MQAHKRSRRQTGFRRADSAKRQTAAIIVFACKMPSVAVVSVLSMQVPAILSLARRPGRPDVLLLRMSADNGDTVSGVTLLVIHHARKPFGCGGLFLPQPEEDRAHDTKERERPRHDRCTVTVGHRRLLAFDRSQDRR